MIDRWLDVDQPKEDNEMSDITKHRSAILSSIKNVVVTRHINITGLDYDAWMRTLDERAPDLLSCNEAAFESGVLEVLKGLGSSHIAFYRTVPDTLPPQHSISATVRQVSFRDQWRWMFLDVFDDGPAQRAGILPGDVLESIDGRPAVPPALPTFAIGRSHQLTITNASGERVRGATIHVPAAKATNAHPPLVAPKTMTHRVVEHDIGVLRVGWFTATMGLQFASELDTRIADLKQAGCERLIVDLRGNIGGGLGFARLASYLCPDQIAIGQSLTPKRLKTGYDRAELPRVPMPSTKTGIVLALTRFLFEDKSLVLLTQGLGAQPFHGRIVVLVNEWTNSAAEMVANFARENGLATVVGNKTAGNVLGASNFKLPAGYWLRLPVFGWFTSQGKSLEGKGVTPEVVVDVDPLRLNAGIDEQLDAAIDIVKNMEPTASPLRSLARAERQ